MKKFTKDIKKLLSVVLVGTTGIGLLTSCGADEPVAGELQRTDDMTGKSSAVSEGSEPYDGGLMVVDDMTDSTSEVTANTDENQPAPDETENKAYVTEEPPMMGEMADPDAYIVTEEKRFAEDPSIQE